MHNCEFGVKTSCRQGQLLKRHRHEMLNEKLTFTTFKTFIHFWKGVLVGPRAKSFHPFKGGTGKVLTCLEGGGGLLKDNACKLVMPPSDTSTDILTQTIIHYRHLM